MEEVETPTEAVLEDIHHHAQHSNEKWVSHVALSSAIIAALAAITALLANHHANEAMLNQIQASDHWGYYQAKSIKGAILSTKVDLLQAIGKQATAEDLSKVQAYRKDQDEISDMARRQEEESESHLRQHVVLARGVTLFQVAIAIAAIAILTRLRRFWYVALLFGTLGLGFLAQGVFLIR